MMDIRRTATSVLRSNWSPFLNGSSLQNTSRRQDQCCSLINRHRSAVTTYRSIATSSQDQQQAAARRPQEDDDDTPTTPQPAQSKEQIAQRYAGQPPEQQPPPRSPSGTTPNRNAPLSFLNRTRTDSQAQSQQQQRPPPSSSPRPSTFNAHDLVPGSSDSQGQGQGLSFLRRRRTDSQRPAPTDLSANPPPGAGGGNMTSVDELIAGMSAAKRDGSGGRANSTPYMADGRSRTDLSSMARPYATPLAPGQLSASQKQATRDYEQSLSRTMAAPTFRLGPGLGRSVNVDVQRGMDVARAFSMLNIRCAANNVRGEVAAQRFHERPGIRRKRLASQRFRKRFKQGFQATVRRVEEMKRKGW